MLSFLKRKDPGDNHCMEELKNELREVPWFPRNMPDSSEFQHSMSTRKPVSICRSVLCQNQAVLYLLFF